MAANFSPVLDWVAEQVAKQLLPTAVIGIASAEGILELGAFGTTQGRAVKPDDQFRLLSITKPLVGLLVGRAIERGQLTLATPLRKALPGFAQVRDDEVRLEHLVSHRAGFIEPQLDSPTPLRESLLTPGRWFTAGGSVSYSSLAFEGITAMLEHADGRAWEAQLADLGASVGAQLTLSEDADPVALVDMDFFDLERFAAHHHPGAGAISRASDLLALGSSLLAGDGRAVRPRTLDLMLRPLTKEVPRLDRLAPWDGQEFGVAFQVRNWRTNLIDPQSFGHTGWTGTQFWIHPKAGVCWTLLTNTPTRPGLEIDALDNLIVSCAS